VRTFLKRATGDRAHPSFVVYPMIVQRRAHPRDGDAARSPARLERWRGHHADDQDGLRGQSQQPTATSSAPTRSSVHGARPERTIVIFDEAYIEFAMAADFPDAFSYIRQGRK